MLRILDYPWHQAHLYRMATILPATFTVAGVKRPYWNEAQRPIPENVRFIEVVDVNPRDYDVAILHLDQWVDRLNMRGYPFRLMNQISQGIPQVVIMHGTPDDERNRRNVLRIIGDLPVICNSQQAAREWDGGEGRLDRYGSPQFRAIIHGYVDEFFHYPLAHRNRGAITICSGGDLSRWYHGLPLVERLKRDVPLTWVGGNDRGDKSWCENYTAYRVMLASSLIYFSPTRRGPMPGARTEAMLSGCCVISVPGNDFEDYIKNDVNGFIVDTYVQARDCLLWLLENPGEAWEIGQRGREDALMFFDHNRYRDDWLSLLEEISLKRVTHGTTTEGLWRI